MIVNRHWHIGNNTPGSLPDNLNACWIAHTAQDALLGLLGELNNIAEAIEEDAEAFDEDEQAKAYDEVTDAIGELEECLPFFTEDGALNLDATEDGSDVAKTLVRLDGELSFLIDNVSHWARSCTENCADA